MRVTREDIAEMLAFIERVENDTETHYVLGGKDDEGTAAPWSFFADRPHLLMSMGFDEYVAFRNKQDFARRWFASSVEDMEQSMYREPTGRWLLLFMAPNARDDVFTFHTRRTIRDVNFESVGARQISFEALLNRLTKIADQWQDDTRTIWSPRLWTPRAQEEHRSLLASTTRRVIETIRDESSELSTLSWRELEEVVAEVLRAQGMEIHLVKQSPQGGRDILARGELIPGEEPVTIAVEVKHRPIIGRPEVQRALWQNRDYPALLFVTSGRFTAGVLKEKALAENRLRLVLKDGVALTEMIRAYKW